MRHYTGVHALALAFGSRLLYRQVASQWRGVGALYLLLLLSMTWIPVLAVVQWGFARFAADDRAQREIPALAIKDGVASSPEPQPRIARDPDTGRALLILDTTGSIPSLEGTDAPVLITRDQIHLRSGRQSARSLRLPLWLLGDRDLDKEDVRSWIQAFGRWIGIALYPVALLVSFTIRMLVALAAGVAVRALAGLDGRELSYRAAVRLTVVAMTPAILLDTVVSTFALPVPHWSLAAPAITGVYLALGVMWGTRKRRPAAVTARPPAS